MKLLTVSSDPKTVKGEKEGYITAVLYLAPAKLSGTDLCKDRSPACTFLCLNTAGRGGIFKTGEKTNAIQLARVRKALSFVDTRETFLSDLVADIRAFLKHADKLGLVPAVRLNGTSDIAWETIPVQGARNIFALFPQVQFYDYTKTFLRLVRQAPNYYLTFSRSESNETRAMLALETGHNVAMVFDNKAPLPASYKGFEVINGDLSDLRFKDRRGVIVGLKAKGRARKDTTGFVIRGTK